MFWSGGLIGAGLVVLQCCTSSGFGNRRPVQASVDGLDLQPPVEKQPPPLLVVVAPRSMDKLMPQGL